MRRDGIVQVALGIKPTLRGHLISLHLVAGFGASRLGILPEQSKRQRDPSSGEIQIMGYPAAPAGPADAFDFTSGTAGAPRSKGVLQASCCFAPRNHRQTTHRSGRALQALARSERPGPVTVRFVETGWERELRDGLVACTGSWRLACPFIKQRAIERLLAGVRLRNLQVVTRFSLADFASGVSDIGALRALVEAGGEVRGLQRLHSKMFVFGNRRAAVTSANLTSGGTRPQRRIRVCV
jgi:hypothetical protein